MNALAATLLIMLIAAVAAFVLSPLSLLPKRQATHDAELAELEAEREAKYRELRDAELDHRLGKLSDVDYDAIDASLRAEALQVLNQIEAIEAGADRDEVVATEPDEDAETNVVGTSAGTRSDRPPGLAASGEAPPPD